VLWCIDDEEAIRPEGTDAILTSAPTAPVTYVDVTSAPFCDFQRYFRCVLRSSSIGLSESFWMPVVVTSACLFQCRRRYLRVALVVRRRYLRVVTIAVVDTSG